MKKLLSMFMVIAVFFSVITFPVKADPTSGSITISNATKGQTYAVYKIFDAEIKFKDGQADGITYQLEKTTDTKALYEKLFGVDGTQANAYFQYNKTNFEVKAIGSDTDIITYLTNVVKELDTSFQPIVAPKVADGPELVFSGLPFGYYLITSSLGTTITINSTTPDVKVIDKNQVPGGGFDKQVQTGTQIIGGKEVPIWGDQNSANIGDLVNYKVSFEATNYDGMNKIQYYQVHDEKGTALWVEFDTVKVFVDGKELDRGYYLCQGDSTTLNTDNWGVLGEWKGVADADKTRENAQWYLVHLGYDKFRITIPWLEGHHITESKVTNAEGHEILSYTLSYSDVNNAKSLYPSPAQVEVYYEAAVEHNANIGDAHTSNLFNKANATWTYTGDSESTKTEIVETKVYGIGITKKDGADKATNLYGAEFEVYRDKDCTKPVYVIPTGVEGVYIVDSLNSGIEHVSGANKETTREIYEEFLAAYLNGATQKNLVVSQANGKLVIIGLAEGDYYLKEIHAPTGYNTLTEPYKITINAGNSTLFQIYADENGKVSNVTQEDATYKEIDFYLVSDTIYNGKGATLPTTGAEGTIKMITIGTFITIACGVLLITNKKMSVYRD